MTNEKKLRQSLVDHCRRMNMLGINQGTSGNLSVRYRDYMLITPSALPYEQMEADDIVPMPLAGEGRWEGPMKPSTEWRFHLDILNRRDSVNGIVHAHPTYATTLAIARKPIPACHYMVAAFGGNTVRCSRYHSYGTEALSQAALQALEDRHACLLANHGIITVAADLGRAMWLAVELETLARQYYHSLLIGGPVLLNDDQIEETLKGFAHYGHQKKTIS